jgi:hypothetical protein
MQSAVPLSARDAGGRRPPSVCSLAYAEGRQRGCGSGQTLPKELAKVPLDAPGRGARPWLGYKECHSCCVVWGLPCTHRARPRDTARPYAQWGERVNVGAAGWRWPRRRERRGFLARESPRRLRKFGQARGERREMGICRGGNCGGWGVTSYFLCSWYPLGRSIAHAASPRLT